MMLLFSINMYWVIKMLIYEGKELTRDNGYDLLLMSELPDQDEKKAELGKIYISTTGEYIVRDPQGIVRKGQLDTKDKELNLNNLERNLNDPAFASAVLKQTTKAKHTVDKEKKAGKNQGKVNGFYKDTAGGKYFIKKPSDKKELFTELLAGLLLKEFINRGLVDEVLSRSLICADFIKLEDGSYGLIQPYVSFTELFKLIGTSYADNSDRNPFMEMINGPELYSALTEKGEYYGLSTALMFSLLLGDYSVHSGNVVVLNKPLKSQKKEPVMQFARIDWGAAFRNFAHPGNNENLLNPYEYSGLLNFKKFTKGYIANYRDIKGLYPKIADKAFELRRKLRPRLLRKIVESAFAKIPADLLDQETQKNLADYLAIISFKTASFGPQGNCQEVVQQFIEVLETRLVLFRQLPKSTGSLYRSAQIDGPVDLTLDSESTFPEQLAKWSRIITHRINEDIDFTKIDFSHLSVKFNRYVELLAQQGQVFNLWQHVYDLERVLELPKNENEIKLGTIYLKTVDGHITGDYLVRDPQGNIQNGRVNKIEIKKEQEQNQLDLKSAILKQTSRAGHTWQHDINSNENIFASKQNMSASEFCEAQGDKPQKKQAYAFVKQYRESAILRRLFTIDSQGGVAIFLDYDKLANTFRTNNPQSIWAKFEDTLQAGFHCYALLKSLKIGPKGNNKDAITEQLKELTAQLKKFTEYANKLHQSLATNFKEISNLDFESPFFYAIDEQTLLNMSGDQLVTICFEELNAHNPSSLLARIVKNDVLWERMDNAYRSAASAFNMRADQPRKKMAQLGLWRRDYIALLIHQEVKISQEVQTLSEEMVKLYRGLPDCLQVAFQERRHSQFLENSYLEAVQSFTQERNSKSPLYHQLQLNFNSLPEDLRSKYQQDFDRYTIEAEQWQFVLLFEEQYQAFIRAKTIAGKEVVVIKMREIQQKLPQTKVSECLRILHTAEQEVITLQEADKVENPPQPAACSKEKRPELTDELTQQPQQDLVHLPQKKDAVNKAKFDLTRWEASPSLKIFNRNSRCFDRQMSIPAMIAVYQELQEAFAAFPEELQGQYRSEAERITQVVINRLVDAFHFAKTLSEKEESLKQLNAFLQKSPQNLQRQFQQTVNMKKSQLESQLDGLKKRDEAYRNAEQRFKAAANNDKLATFTPLKDAFTQLQSLQEIYQPNFDNYQNLANYLQCLQNLCQPGMTAGQYNSAFSALNAAFLKLSQEDKQALQSSFNEIKVKQEGYHIFGSEYNSVLDSHHYLPITEVDDIVSRLQTGKQGDKDFPDAVREDGILLDVVFHNTDKKKLSVGIVKDILTLKQFYDRKVQLNYKQNYGEKYRCDLDQFYRRAITIRLSDFPLKTQLEKITETAHQEFHHRHDNWRLLADALLVISSLIIVGLIIGAGRVIAGKTFFLNDPGVKNKTDRETELTTSWLTKEAISAEENDTCLFNSPIIVASA
jgi:hypothetical protein